MVQARRCAVKGMGPGGVLRAARGSSAGMALPVTIKADIGFGPYLKVGLFKSSRVAPRKFTAFRPYKGWKAFLLYGFSW